jgi:hypothetical protein
MNKISVAYLKKEIEETLLEVLIVWMDRINGKLLTAHLLKNDSLVLQMLTVNPLRTSNKTITTDVNRLIRFRSQ